MGLSFLILLLGLIDVFGNSVENMDFNKDFDILASTFQSGELQLFSMKSFRKLQRYRLDMK